MSENGEGMDSSVESFPERFNSLLTGIDSLPTLPTILWEVQAALHQKQNGSTEIAQVIEQDLSLTANILRLANSAHYGSSNRFVSVVDAVTRIGLREIGRLVNATLMIDTFSGLENSLDYTEFWSHSLQVAEVAGLLADQNPDATSLLATEAYMLGLLHDVGKLLLDQYFAEDFKRSRAYAVEHNRSDSEAERSVLSMDHGEMAAGLLELWNLQPALIEAVRFQHNVEASDGDVRRDAELVCHADAICHLYLDGELNEDSLLHPSFSLEYVGLDGVIKLLEQTQERSAVLLS
ncbi:HDOD domain-containing protein [bacterium AH-315-P07]|nr:HDOD domain-containing protein [bacterium AH-315-P07]